MMTARLYHALFVGVANWRSWRPLPPAAPSQCFRRNQNFRTHRSFALFAHCCVGHEVQKIRHQKTIKVSIKEYKDQTSKTKFIFHVLVHGLEPHDLARFYHFQILWSLNIPFLQSSPLIPWSLGPLVPWSSGQPSMQPPVKEFYISQSKS